MADRVGKAGTCGVDFIAFVRFVGSADFGLDERYSVEEGLEFRWDKGWTTGLTYRRRDIYEGAGDNDNGLGFDFSFPLWKAPKKPDATAQRVEELEKRLAAVEGQAPSGDQ